MQLEKPVKTLSRKSIAQFGIQTWMKMSRRLTEVCTNGPRQARRRWKVMLHFVLHMHLRNAACHWLHCDATAACFYWLPFKQFLSKFRHNSLCKTCHDAGDNIWRHLQMVFSFHLHHEAAPSLPCGLKSMLQRRLAGTWFLLWLPV